MSVHKSPLALKQRVGTLRTYIRPLQRDLDLTPLSDEEDMVCRIGHGHLCYVLHVAHIVLISKTHVILYLHSSSNSVRPVIHALVFPFEVCVS